MGPFVMGATDPTERDTDGDGVWDSRETRCKGSCFDIDTDDD